MAAKPRPLSAERTVWPWGSRTVDLGVTNTRALMETPIIACRRVDCENRRYRLTRQSTICDIEVYNSIIKLSHAGIHRTLPCDFERRCAAGDRPHQGSARRRVQSAGTGRRLDDPGDGRGGA